MALSFGFALPNAGNNFRGDIFSQLLPADQRVEAASGTQEVANGCLDNRVVELRAIMPEVTNTNLLFNSSMAGATGSVLPTNWASGSVSGLTYTISSASTVQGFRSIEWTVSGTALSDGDLWLACEPMQSGTVSAQIPSEYVGSMYCAKVSGTIKAGMVLQTLTQNFINGAVQETKTKDLAAVTGQTFVRIEPNSVKTDVDLENRVNLRLYQSIASGEVIDFTIRVAAPQVEAGVTASPFISTVSGAVSEVRGRPSILVVPQLTKAGTVYPQLPTVSGADFTFTRATTATRVNASGLIESVASGLLRLDYPVTGGCPAALIEPSAQNLAWHSETWAAANNWSLSEVTRATGSTDAFKAPDGTFTANAISPTSGNVQHRLFGNISTNIAFTSGTIYTQSAFFKAGTGNAGRYVQLTFQGTQFSQLGFANFDLQNGVIVASGGTADANRNARIENYGNGWYRCSFTATCNVSGSTFGLFPSLITASGDTRAPSFAGTVTDVLYGWGAQLETGAIPTSYIPTTAASATRNADVCSVSGVSGYIGQTEGTMYFEVSDVKGVGTGTGNPALAIRDAAFTNWIGLISNSVSTPFRIQVRSTTTTLINYTSAITEGKVAIAYSANGAVVYVNGLEVASTATNPNLTLNIVMMEQYMPFKVKSLALYRTRLSNDQLANITRLT